MRFLELNFDVLHAADNTVFAVGTDIRLVNSGPRASFSEGKLTTSNVKSSESFVHPNVLSLMYELTKSSFGQNDLSFGFKRDQSRRREDSSSRAVMFLPKYVRGFFHLRVLLKDVFWLCRTSKECYIWLRIPVNFDKR